LERGGCEKERIVDRSQTGVCISSIEKKIFIDKNLLFLCQHVQMYILYSVEIENSISICYLYTSQCIRHVATKATSAIPMLWIMVKGMLFKSIYE